MTQEEFEEFRDYAEVQRPLVSTSAKLLPVCHHFRSFGVLFYPAVVLPCHSITASVPAIPPRYCSFGHPVAGFSLDSARHCVKYKLTLVVRQDLQSLQ